MIKNWHLKTVKYLFIILFLDLIGCSTSPRAPVINRAPPAQTPTKIKPPVEKTGDWRPDTYIVKKGDNLMRIGLEYGYDYKEIAAANQIAPPYVIKVGQKLDFSSLKSKNTSTENASNEDVVVSPIKTEPPPEAKTAETKTAAQNLTGPKATREPYSQTAMQSKPQEAPKTEQPKQETAKQETAKQELPSNAVEVNDWQWPTEGKVIANFVEGSSKGMDISGKMGQAVNAAKAGKVIYSGADLRGYGKLIIIKHDKTYLSVYAHNSKILVKEGQTVTSGQKIAEMGNTDSANVKLHFEVREQGRSVDPAKFLPPH